MAVKLSSLEGEVLANISVRAGMRVPTVESDVSALEQRERRACRALARKGLLDMTISGQYRVNQSGLERVKQVY